MKITKEVTKQVEETIGYKCDCCGKEVAPEIAEKFWYEGHYGVCDYEPDYIYVFVCSVKCLTLTIGKGLKFIGGYKSGEVFGFNEEFAKRLYEQLLTVSEIKVEETPQFIKLQNELTEVFQTIAELKEENKNLKNKLFRFQRLEDVLKNIKETDFE